MKKYLTILLPYKLDNNISFDIKRKYLEEKGYIVSRLSEALKKMLCGYKIANLNFYESSYTSSKIKCQIDYIVKSFILWLMRIRKVKIVYTLHNRIGHDSKFVNYEKQMMRKLCKQADRIVILSDDTREVIQKLLPNKYDSIQKKIVKIPLVSYESAYIRQGKNLRNEFKINEESMLFTFLGGIRRYKNIEIIIDTARRMKDCSNVHFLIAGSGDRTYIEEVKNQAEEIKNITIIDRFISNDEMADLADITDVFVFPYDKHSSLNSGSCMYAFSFKRNVVCPKIGTINELENDITYSYDYNEKSDHIESFFAACFSAYEEWKKQPDLFKEKQQILYKRTLKENAVPIIASKYDLLYKELIEEKEKG